MEYMDSRTLETLMKSQKKLFSESSLAKIAKQVVLGLDYLHSHKVIYRYLKPSNFVVNHDMEVKIADFGVSKMMCRTLDPCNSYVGTCTYMSSERFDPDTYDGNYNGYAGDIWSLGLTLMELYMGHFPLLLEGQRPDWVTLMCSICFCELLSLSTGASPEFKDFIDCCLQKESGKRWSTHQLLQRPFVKELKDIKLKSQINIQRGFLDFFVDIELSFFESLIDSVECIFFHESSGRAVTGESQEV